MTASDAVPMSEMQLRSIRESTGRVNLWSGSVRSGKTIASLLRWLIYIAGCTNAGELIVVARTRETAARNVFAPLMDPALFGAAARSVQYTAGAPTGTILGHTVHVVGASDAKAEKVIRGLTCAGAYVDEVTVLPYEFFAQLLFRLWDQAKLFGTTNPDSPRHWLMVKYLKRLGALGNWRHWRFTLDDNPALTDENKAAIKAENVGLFYRRFVLGEWVQAEGAIYDMWDEATHLVPWTDLPAMSRVYGVGVDYGTTNATAGVALGHGQDGKLYLLDEWRHDIATGAVKWTDAQLSAGLRAWLPTSHTPHQSEPSVEWVYVDPAAASFKTQLYYDGQTNIANADNDVLSGIRTVASLLATDRLRVTDRCVGLVEEIPGYVWSTKASETGRDEPVKDQDHSLDAARYAVQSTASLWRPALGVAA